MQVIVQQLRFTNLLIIIKSVPSCLCRTRTLEDNAGILMIAEPHAPPAPKRPSFFQAHQHTNWGVTTQVDPSSASQVGTGPASVSSEEVLSPWLDWSGHKKTWLLARYFCPVKKQPSCIFFLRRKPTIWTSFLRNKISTTRGRHFDSRTEILQAIPRPIIIFRMFAHMHSNEVFAEDLVHLLKHRFWPKLEFKNKANTRRSYLESHKPKLAEDFWCSACPTFRTIQF